MPTGGDERAAERATAVLSVFGDAAPQTAESVATAVGIDVEAAKATLSDLVDRGALCQKEVRGVDGGERLPADELDALTVPLWYLPAERLSGGDVVVTVDDERAVEAALAELSLPGASELMRDWRRDAVRACYEYLHDRGTAADEDFRADVYPAHAAGYTNDEDWWDCVGPRLETLPGVERDEGWTLDR